MAGKYLDSVTTPADEKTIASGPAQSGSAGSGGVSAAVSAALDFSEKTTQTIRDVISGGTVNYRTGTAPAGGVAPAAGISWGRWALIAGAAVAGYFIYRYYRKKG